MLNKVTHQKFLKSDLGREQSSIQVWRKNYSCYLILVLPLVHSVFLKV